MLTQPDERTADDDGYLSASEVMALRLNADLVVLSACDSAGGYRDANDGGQTSGEIDAGRGSEVFEGPASAFLYAGARHLYVSHWRIEAPAASRLISAAFRSLGAGGGSRPPSANRASRNRHMSWNGADHSASRGGRLCQNRSNGLGTDSGP